MRKTRENRFNLVCCEVKQGINHFYHTRTRMNIFSRLIATSQTPPLSGARPDLTLNDSLIYEICEACWLFFCALPSWLSVFLNDANTLQSVPRSIFFPRIQELGSTGAAGAWWIEWRVCAPSDAMRSLWTLVSSRSSCISIVLSYADAIKHNKCVPLLHFLFGAFIYACLYLRGDGEVYDIYRCVSMCACIRSLSLYRQGVG